MGRQKKNDAQCFVGIDSGTRNTVVMVRFPDGRLEAMADIHGDIKTISAIGYEDGDPDRLLIGRAATGYRPIAPQNVTVMNKRMRSQGIVALVDKDNRPWTAEEMETRFLKCLIENVQERTGLPVRGVVIGVPACFTDAQRKASLELIKQAGFKAIAAVNEPTAAIAGYLKDKRSFRHVIVVDIGCGTSDITIAEVVSPNELRILATEGKDDMGGRDITMLLVQRCVDVMAQKGVVCEPDQNLKDYVMMENSAEDAKCMLSTQQKAYIAWRVGNELFDLEVTRSDFDHWIASITEGIRGLIQQALAKANLTADEIDGVLPVGGSSRVCAIQDLLVVSFGPDKILKDVNPDLAVATGLGYMVDNKIVEAIDQGDHVLQNDTSGYVFNVMQVKDILGRAIGVLAWSEQTHEDYFVPLLPENTTLPFKASKIFGVTHTCGEVAIKLLEGKTGCSPKEAQVLTTINLQWLPPGPTRERIEISMDIDLSGTVIVRAVDRLTGNEIQGSIDVSHVIVKGSDT